MYYIWNNRQTLVQPFFALLSSDHRYILFGLPTQLSWCSRRCLSTHLQDAVSSNRLKSYVRKDITVDHDFDFSLTFRIFKKFVVVSCLSMYFFTVHMVLLMSCPSLLSLLSIYDFSKATFTDVLSRPAANLFLKKVKLLLTQNKVSHIAPRLPRLYLLLQ